MARSKIASAVMALALFTGACHRPANADGGSPSPDALVGTAWTLTMLHGQPAPLGAGNRSATLIFDTNAHVSGFAGCNRVAGSYTRSGDSLHIGPLVMTRMACTEGMELEQQYSGALGATQHYRITVGVLELLQGDTVLARFERRISGEAGTRS